MHSTGGLWKQAGVNKMLWFEVRQGCYEKVFQGYLYDLQSCKAIQRLGDAIQKVKQEKKMEFINRHGKKFHCYNEEIHNDENVEEFHQKLMHPDIIAKILGVELDNDYKKTLVPALQI